MKKRCQTLRISLIISLSLIAMALATLWPAETSAATPSLLRTLSTSDGLPSDEVEQLMQDSRGYIWGATRNGLVRYDGSRTETYKSGIRRGEVLTHNDIRAITEDNRHRIWIGTVDGVNVYDMTTGTFRKRPDLCNRNNTISCILATRSGRLFIGTDQGLYEYLDDSDTTLLYTRQRSGDVMPQTSVKALMEDSRGHIWIGTWNEGIYRLDNKGKFHAYPRINERKSAHVIFEDSRHRIWVGSWGCGLFMLRNPYDPQKAGWIRYANDPANRHSLCDNIIYSISEDPATRTLWVGTRRGVSLLNEENAPADGASSFITLTTPDDQPDLREVTSIFPDRTGNMWISILGHGAMAFTTRTPPLSHDPLKHLVARFGTAYVSRLLADRQGRLWISLGSNAGLVVYDPRTGDVIDTTPLPFSAGVKTPYTVTSLLEEENGNILVGTYDGGLYRIDSSMHLLDHFTRANHPWLAGDRVSELFIDSRHRLWTGGLPGLSLVTADGSYLRFDDIVGKEIQVYSIAEGSDGVIWVATVGQGMLRIDGSGTDASTYSVKRYLPSEGTLNTLALSVVYCDNQGRVWAGSGETGLSLYDFETDSFLPVQMKWNLPGETVSIILGDATGNLWVATDKGLVNLMMAEAASLDNVHFRVFSATDGAQGNYFHRKAACRDHEGHLYFGGPNGLNIISGNVREAEGVKLPVSLTDIRVEGVSWSDMLPEERTELSPLSPPFCEKITLPHEQNSFAVEFGVLDYSDNLMQRKYSYRLEGFDKDWIMADNDRRVAYYSNLPSGTYRLHVRVSDPYGGWEEEERQIEVKVLPSLWGTWWAKLIYAALICGAIVMGVRYWRGSLSRRNYSRLRRLLHAQAQELAETQANLRRLTGELEAADPDEPQTLLKASEWGHLSRSKADEEFLNRALEVVQAHIADPELTQEVFMDKLGVTKSTLFRKLKALTGLSYTAFVRHIRLKAALHIIHTQKGVRISEVAYAVGFNDPKYFSYCFRKEFGMLPSEYIDRNLTTEEPADDDK